MNETVNQQTLKELTKESLKRYWEMDDNALHMKHGLGLRLSQYAAGKKFDHTTKITPEDEKIRTKVVENFRKSRGKKRSSREQQFNRLLLGYYGIPFNLTPKRCNLSSEAANLFSDQKGKTTNDHVVGVTDASIHIINEFRKDLPDNPWEDLCWVSERIKYMCNDWLPENLWLWAQCRVTREEHKADNLKREVKKDIEYKLNLEHYNEANIKIEQYK